MTDNNFVKLYSKVAALWKMTINSNANEALAAYRTVIQMVHKHNLKAWNEAENIPLLLTDKKKLNK